MIAPVLHEMGLAETKGSGIRVMRRLMEEARLSPPSFDSDRYRDQFVATYLFHHFLTEEDIQWLGRFRSLGLTEDQQRALIFVRETGRITNSDYRDLNRVDTLTASQRLTRMRDLGLVEQVPRGSATYYVPGSRLGLPTSGHEEPAHDDLFAGLSPESGELPGQSAALSDESRGLPRESAGLSRESGRLSRDSLLQELPEHLRHQIDQLGHRSRDTGRFQSVLVMLCAHRAYSLRELATITDRNSAYLQHQYLTPLVRAGRLRRKYPDAPNRPDQAYLTAEEQE